MNDKKRTFFRRASWIWLAVFLAFAAWTGIPIREHTLPDEVDRELFPASSKTELLKPTNPCKGTNEGNVPVADEFV